MHFGEETACKALGRIVVGGIVHAQIGRETAGVGAVGDPSVQQEDEGAVPDGANGPPHRLENGIDGRLRDRVSPGKVAPEPLFRIGFERF